MASRREKPNGHALPASTEREPVSLPPRPMGKPRGSRNALGEQFIGALCADFERYGVDVIARVREDDPAVYLRVIAQAVPQTLVMQDAKLDELSDDELAAYLRAVRDALGDAQKRSDDAPSSDAHGVS